MDASRGTPWVTPPPPKARPASSMPTSSPASSPNPKSSSGRHQEDLQELKDQYYPRHPPASPEARCLLDQIVLCEWHLRRFSWVEDSLWDEYFTASPQGSDPCAYALERGDQTFTRLQHRINPPRRAFQTALKELERLEARDQDAVVVSPDSVSPVTQTPETQLRILGSIRKNESADPAAGEMPPRQYWNTGP